MPSVLLVGAGKMGGALLCAWKKQKGIRVLAIDPAGADGTSVFASPAKLPSSFRPDVIVLAVKPQMMAEVAPDYARFGKAVFISIAAGTSIATLKKFVGKDTAIIRTMPNLPAIIGQGVTVAVPNRKVSATQRKLADRLLAAAGQVHWLKDEKLMDAVVAVSGSGPAYLFHLAEALAAAGVKAGLPKALAGALARETICGSAALLRHSKESPELLRKNVTSKGGTTEAALKILMGEKGLKNLMELAVEAAKDRSVKLNK